MGVAVSPAGRPESHRAIALNLHQSFLVHSCTEVVMCQGSGPVQMQTTTNSAMAAVKMDSQPPVYPNYTSRHPTVAGLPSSLRKHLKMHGADAVGLIAGLNYDSDDDSGTTSPSIPSSNPTYTPSLPTPEYKPASVEVPEYKPQIGAGDHWYSPTSLSSHHPHMSSLGMSSYPGLPSHPSHNLFSLPTPPSSGLSPHFPGH